MDEKVNYRIIVCNNFYLQHLNPPTVLYNTYNAELYDDKVECNIFYEFWLLLHAIKVIMGVCRWRVGGGCGAHYIYNARRYDV